MCSLLTIARTRCGLEPPCSAACAAAGSMRGVIACVCMHGLGAACSCHGIGAAATVLRATELITAYNCAPNVAATHAQPERSAAADTNSTCAADAQSMRRSTSGRRCARASPKASPKRSRSSCWYLRPGRQRSYVLVNPCRRQPLPCHLKTATQQPAPLKEQAPAHSPLTSASRPAHAPPPSPAARCGAARPAPRRRRRRRRGPMGRKACSAAGAAAGALRPCGNTMRWSVVVGHAAWDAAHAAHSCALCEAIHAGKSSETSPEK